MKRIVFLILAVVVTSLLSLSTASAQFNPNSTVCNTATSGSSAAANTSLCTTNAATANPLFGTSGIITIVVQIFSWLVGIAAVFMIVIGGFMYITSGGEPQRTNQAKNTILFAVVGVVIAAVAQIIIHYVLNQL